MSRLRLLSALVGLLLVIAAAVSAPAAAKPVREPRSRVVVPPGQPVQIAVAVDDTGFGAFFGPSAREAVQMAIEHHPELRGFAIQVNSFNAICDNGSAASLAANATIANSVVSNLQNVAVLGHTCSAEAPAWLPVYQGAGVATINGSTTGSTLPALGPTVFNGTAVPDPAFTAWYATVKALPSDVAWRARFQARFGSAPTDYADLYYDAAGVLLAAVNQTARVEHHTLVIDRAALTARVRHTRHFRGVTCTVTLDPATGYRINDPAALAWCARQKG
jgi:ABC-type branched-subunit amino acid transport system substrate-binding protein